MQGKIVLIGPSSPPYGGARTSFDAFRMFLHNHRLSDNVTHLDLPVRNGRLLNPPGGVNYFRTLFALLRNLLLILRSSTLIIFGSRHFCYSFGVLLIALCQLSNVKIYFRFFGGYPFKELKGRFFIIRNVVAYFLQKAEKIVVQTETGASQFPEALQKKICVVPGYRFKNNHVEIPRSKAHKRKWKFVYVGLINEKKGVRDLLEAYQDLVAETDKSYELHLYGAKSNDLSLKDGPDTVIYHGDVPNSQILACLPTYDTLIFPSKYSTEGHPGVLVEAFMSGLPVIATKLPGVYEMITDGKNGILFQPGDVPQLKLAMFKVSHDEALAVRISKGALRSFTKYNAKLLLPKLAKSLGLITT